MSLQIILKNSSVSGKEPTASQLANGELALNYHADGPFISCKDSAGTVRRIAGVWISTTAPTSPTPGEFWLDTNTDPAKLKVYKDGTDTWVETITIVAASTTAAGVVELATDAETQAGTDTLRAVTPASLQSKISDSTATTSSTTIASSTAVKSAKDVADAALPAAGGTISGNLTVSGDLTVNGTTTTIDTTTLIVEDKNIEMGAVGTPTDVTADGGGITLKGATDKTLNWVDSTDSWTSSENVDLASGKTYKIAGTDVLSGTTLGSGVTGSSLTSVGTITTGVWNGTALTSSAIGADAINGSKIADDSIDSEHYVDGSIDTVHLADDAVDASKLANTTVTAGSYTAADITVDAQGRITAAASGTISTAEIADGAVTSAKIEDGTIVNADVSATAAIAGTKIDADFGAQDLTVDTNVLHVDATNNRVGVGSASPDNKLDIREDGTFSQDTSGQLVLRGTTDSNKTLRIGFDTTSDYGYLQSIQVGTAAKPLILQPWAGSVGIGTTSPTRDFDLVRTSGDTNMRIESTGVGGDGRLELIGDNTGVSQIRFGDQDTVNVGLITYDHGTDSFRFNTNSAERLRLDSSGNVGIGTTSPAARTEINESSNGAETFPLYVANRGTGVNTRASIRFNVANSYYGSIGGGAESDGSSSLILDASSATGVVKFTRNNKASESARLDGSGRLLVGTTTARTTGSGFIAYSQVESAETVSGASFSLISNRSTDTLGSRLSFARSKGGSLGSNTVVAENDELGGIYFYGADGTDTNSRGAQIVAEVDDTPGANDMPGRLVFGTTANGETSPTTRMTIQSNGKIKVSNGIFYRDTSGGIGFGSNGLYPTNSSGSFSDNTYDLGNASFRWDTVFAGTGTINTSDANLKQDIEILDQAELNVAVAIKGLIKKFRFIDAVAGKGDDARVHVGVIAQEVEQAFIAEGLDPRRYALFCEDILEDGSKRLGVRYNELLAFVIAAL